MTAVASQGGTGLVGSETAAAAEAIDWSNLDLAAAAAESVLDAVAERIQGGPGVDLGIPAEFTGCVLAEGGLALLSGDSVEIAICHLRPPERAVAQPHHVHPRPVAVRVLHGHLRLALFGRTGPRLAEGHLSEDPSAPRFLREDGPGRTVTLHAEQRHTLEIDRPTALLVLRGPAGAVTG